MTKKKKASDVAPPDAETIRGREREAMALWMKERAREIANYYDERIELLRTVGEHPSPIFQNIVRMHGAYGMPKKLVARFLNISVSTLNQFYAEDYDLGEISALSSVMANAVRIGSSVTHPDAGRMIPYILDRRGGPSWKPPAQKVITKDERDAPPIIDSSKLSYEDRQVLRKIAEKALFGEQQPEAPADDSVVSSQPGMDLIE